MFRFNGTGFAIVVLCLQVMAAIQAAEPGDPVEEALSAVRDVKIDMFSRTSSVLGELPGPADLAAAQMRTRPIPQPQLGAPQTVAFTAEKKSVWQRSTKAEHDRNSARPEDVVAGRFRLVLPAHR